MPNRRPNPHLTSSPLVTFALVVALATVAAACGGGGSSGTRVARIGVVAPLQAGLAPFGRGIRNSVELAVVEANRRHALPGWRLEVKALDDSSDPPRVRRRPASWPATRRSSAWSARTTPAWRPGWHRSWSAPAS